MELFLIVLRNIAIALVIAYALVLIVGIAFVCSFVSIMSHHNHDLTVILTTKRDELIKLEELLVADDVPLDQEKVAVLEDFDLKRIENQDGEVAKNARDELTSLYEYFLGVVNNKNGLLDNDDYQLVLSNLTELENVYRHHLMMYNADVLGYNFWINFFPTRFIFKILRFKKKDNI